MNEQLQYLAFQLRCNHDNRSMKLKQTNAIHHELSWRLFHYRLTDRQKKSASSKLYIIAQYLVSEGLNASDFYALSVEQRRALLTKARAFDKLSEILPFQELLLVYKSKLARRTRIN